MYIIKEIKLNKFNNSIEIIDGISCALINDKLIPFDEFWGKTEIMTGNFTDWRLLKNKSKEDMLTYCNEINVQNLDDGYKKLLFNVSTPNKIDGYIVILRNIDGKIDTNGIKIFGRYYNEGIFLLKENKVVSFENYHVKVIDGHLYLNI